MIRKLILLGMAIVLSACTSQAPPVAKSSCPVTTPSEQPASLPTNTDYEGRFWYGTPALWTNLPADGVWSALPHDKAGFVQKTVFWRERFDAASEPKPALTVSGHRLDASAPKFSFSDATHGFDETGDFMLIGISIPTEGCWKITAKYKDASLSYVVLVAP